MPAVVEVADLERLHRARVPKMFYDYAESGSWTELTFRRNEAAFAELLLRQRVAVDIAERSTHGTMLGQHLAMPVALAPTGLAGMQHADGEILAARAAENFGVPFTLSTMSICSIEDVADNDQMSPLAGPGKRLVNDLGLLQRLDHCIESPVNIGDRDDAIRTLYAPFASPCRPKSDNYE